MRRLILGLAILSVLLFASPIASADIDDPASNSERRDLYESVNDLPEDVYDLQPLVEAWLNYPEKSEVFYPTEPEVTITAGEKTKVTLFRHEWLCASDYELCWYGDGDVTMQWASGGVGWAGHSQIAYITAEKPCTIFVSATDNNGIIAHMVIYAE